LKIGTMSLVLELVERRECPQLEVAQPVDATKSISRDQTYDWIIELKDGRKISAIDIQRMYLEKAQKYCDRTDQEVVWLLEEWENVLNDLEVDFTRCVDRIDWVAKKYLLNTFQESEKLEWIDPCLQSIDLEYHNIAWEQGLYHELVRENQIRRILKEDDIKTAIFMPPESTRAYFRGRSVARFNSQIHSIHWDEVVFDQDSGQRRVSFNHASEDDRIDLLNAVIREAANYEDFLHRLEKFDR
jgi:Pup amidohydrolase